LVNNTVLLSVHYPDEEVEKRLRVWFVRFINVFNVDRLVSNLCTIWVDRSKFHANIARFHRPPLNSNKATEKKNVESHRGGYHVPRKDGGDMGKSFVNVVKSNTRSGSVECDSTPAIVLDEECLYSKDLTNSLLGRVKEFASLTNLKTALQNEGFADINVKYMGELWVLIEFNSPKSKDLFRNNVGVGSWFSEMREASIDFNPDGRIVWVEVEGVPLKFWSGNTFKRIAEKWGELLDVDDQEENCYHSKRLCLYTKMHINNRTIENFKIIFRGKVFWIRAKEVPGWVPELLEEAEDDENSEDGFMEGVNKTDDAENCGENSDVAEIPEMNFDESIGLKVGFSQGADEFNFFIVNAGLEEVPLGGSTFPCAITLERYLSDHRPILLREAANDYGPDEFLKVKDFVNGSKVIGLTKELVDRYKDELRMLDLVIDKGDGTDAVVTKRMEVINSMLQLDHLHALDMAQKAKIKWAVEGDENTRFFHGILNKKRNQQNIRGVMVDGVWNDKPHDVKNEFLIHFRKRFEKPLDGGCVRAVKFFTHGDIPKGCNSSFVALIPKVPDANLVNDFRPISLIGSIYKVIAKILANRLVRLWNHCELRFIGLYIAGRQIFDVQFILNEVSDWKVGCLFYRREVKSCLSKEEESLSIGGRLTLLNRHFFNGHELGNNKATWVKWSRVLTTIDHGGLGVSSLYALNRGLMVKWFWRFYSQKTSLWANVIKAIHGEDGNVDKAHYIGGRTCWTSIVHEVKVLCSQGVNILDCMRLKLGDGENTNFWKDNWCSGGILKDLFPRLYALESCKLVNVCTKLNDPSLVSSFRLPMADRWVWNLESSGDFSVSSIRKVIDEKRFPSVCSKTRWVKYVSIKVNVLAWKIKIDALPTRFNISRRGIDIHSILCPVALPHVCDGGVESSEHLFFRCHLSKQIARKVSLWWNVAYVDVNSYAEWYSWIVSLRIAAKSKLMLEEVSKIEEIPR
ncbi:RNA-directed DNA polymerase, eukaryota, reverse transcriptase zinc-binding domain protein, partial [Tanacetum coccineum]